MQPLPKCYCSTSYTQPLGLIFNILQSNSIKTVLQQFLFWQGFGEDMSALDDWTDGLEANVLAAAVGPFPIL